MAFWPAVGGGFNVMKDVFGMTASDCYGRYEVTIGYQSRDTWSLDQVGE
jgi:hypothetical protein